MGFIGGSMGNALGGRSADQGQQAAGGVFQNPNPIDEQLGMPNLMGNLMNSTMNNFNPTGVPIQMPITSDQATNAYNQAQSGLGQQQAFVNALMGQNGVGNLANVYNQYSNVASGQGPNPAQAMLSQATGQNVANQAALMGSQRGVSSNVGLGQRQAALAGSNAQQQAAGQAASLQAQQQLAALGSMGNIAGQQIGAQGQALTGYNQMAQNQQANLLNAIAQQNNANIGQQSSLNSIRSGVNQQNAQTNANIIGGGMNAVGSLAAFLHDGGEVPIPSVTHYRTEGQHTAGQYADGGPVSFAGQFLNGITSQVHAPSQLNVEQAPMQSPQQGKNPFEIKMPMPGKGEGKAHGGPIQGKKGIHKVPGKASVSGDSLKNDTVPAMLSPGEIVIPRSHAQDPHKAAEFARAVVMKNRKGKK